MTRAAKPRASRSGRGGAREGAGRPALPVEIRRDRVLSTRVSTVELGVFTAVAEHHGMTLGDWLRGLARRAAGLVDP